MLHQKASVYLQESHTISMTVKEKQNVWGILFVWHIIGIFFIYIMSLFQSSTFEKKKKDPI